jgi:hypothetical protein
MTAHRLGLALLASALAVWLALFLGAGLAAGPGAWLAAFITLAPMALGCGG